MRQLLPVAFYPGRKRVGADLARLEYGRGVPVFDGLDWHWIPSIARALAFLVRHRPDVLVLQWWSGTVLHSYMGLALGARLLGSKVLIEFHEVLDPGEARIPLARAFVNVVGPLLLRLADGFVIHSEFDHDQLQKRYWLGLRPVELIPHGPYDQYLLAKQGSTECSAPRLAPAGCCNLLYFGVIRPYKGVEDLITAFDRIPEDEITRYWLTVVGETWEGWTLPTELIAHSRYRDRITFVNRYVSDEEAAALFAAADGVVLPYHRASASGPLHLAMSHGLPVVVTRVGGLVEAAAGYAGAVLVPPRNAAALCEALSRVASLRGQRFSDPHSWEQTVRRYERLFDRLASDPNVMLEAPA
jgi:glycosyltransferase involved in cell wall biosynthesis